VNDVALGPLMRLCIVPPSDHVFFTSGARSCLHLSVLTHIDPVFCVLGVNFLKVVALDKSNVSAAYPTVRVGSSPSLQGTEYWEVLLRFPRVFRSYTVGIRFLLSPFASANWSFDVTRDSLFDHLQREASSGPLPGIDS